MSETAVSRNPNRVDDTILRLADSHSPEEISRALGGIISPSAVASHLQKLLKTRNWLTQAQEEQLVMFKMRMLLMEIEDKYQDDKMFGLRIKALKEIGQMLEKRKAAVEVDLGKLYENQGKLMGQVVDRALVYMKGALRDSVEPDKWDELVKEALFDAQAEISRHEAIDE